MYSVPDAKEEMRSLFNAHVKYRCSIKKTFKEDKIFTTEGVKHVYVWGCLSTNPYTKITYDYDGVRILYYNRMTEFSGDVDRYVTRQVMVDDVVVYHETLSQ